MKFDLTGQTFGRLVVISFAKRRIGSGNAMWNCVCVCKKTSVVESFRLRSGQTKSCGCIGVELLKQRSITHGMRGTAGYYAWISMLSRCNNPGHAAYKNYGGRGIKVCQRWKSFENFWADMGPTHHRSLSLERNDNSKGYFKANCCWATQKQQNRNQRRNILILTPIGEMCVTAAAEHYGLVPATLFGRLERGWTGERLFQPVTRKV